MLIVAENHIRFLSLTQKKHEIFTSYYPVYE
jgi:hypothetical protein